MSDFDRNYVTATRDTGAGRSIATHAGLRAYRVRNWLKDVTMRRSKTKLEIGSVGI